MNLYICTAEKYNYDSTVAMLVAAKSTTGLKSFIENRAKTDSFGDNNAVWLKGRYSSKYVGSAASDIKDEKILLTEYLAG